MFNVFFFLAITPTTGTSSNFESFLRSIFIPFFLASSRRLTQTIIFEVISLI